MTSRDRVMAALNFEPTDRIPKDLGGMRSTGISAFAYPSLVDALGLPPRKPRVYDTGQMLALPDIDVLDALGCDVVTVELDGLTNALDRERGWRDYDFGGRLDARVRYPRRFRIEKEGGIVQGFGSRKTRMVPGSFVFDLPHGGESFNLSADFYRENLARLRRHHRFLRLPDWWIRKMGRLLQEIRANTDRAIFLGGIGAGMYYRTGIAPWSMTCLVDPDHVHEVHRIVTDTAAENLYRLLKAVGDDVDIYMVNADDQGTQNAPILPPEVFRELYVPYYRKVNDAVAAASPTTKRFLHSCGAIYDLIDPIADAGFDVLNPVQWPAGGRTPAEWADRCRGRIALWGGGIDTQGVLPFASPGEAGSAAAESAAVFAGRGGYVFTPIHNILAEIPGESVAAMYRAVNGI